MVDRDRDELPSGLRDAARTMREDPPPSDLWRQRVLREVAALPRPERAKGDAYPRRWSFRPLAAVAAGLACALIGASAAGIAMRWGGEGPSPPDLAASTPSRIRFTIVAPSATRVSIVGDFNAWNPAVLPLRRAPDGRTWEVEVPLAPGRYAYAFVVDGTLARDPLAPQAQDDDFGSPNSVLMVKADGGGS